MAPESRGGPTGAEIAGWPLATAEDLAVVVNDLFPKGGQDGPVSRTWNFRVAQELVARRRFLPVDDLHRLIKEGERKGYFTFARKLGLTTTTYTFSPPANLSIISAIRAETDSQNRARAEAARVEQETVEKRKQEFETEMSRYVGQVMHAERRV